MGYRRMNGWRALGFCLTTSILAPSPARSGDADDVIRALARKDAIVAEVGERLSIAAAGLCPPGWAAGLILQSRAQYGARYRAAASRVLGLDDYPTITYVVPGGAAVRAGISGGDQLVAIDSLPTATPSGASIRASMDVTQQALDMLDAGLADGQAMLRVRRNGMTSDIRLIGARACQVRFEVRPGGSANASAGRNVVQVSSDLVDPGRADSDLAPLIAHELSHIILRHADTLRRHQGGLLPGFGKGGTALRASETAADRLSVYLLAMANYRPADAIAYWSRFARGTDQGVLSDRTHPGWITRVEAIRIEVDRVAAQSAAGRPVSPPVELMASAYR